MQTKSLSLIATAIVVLQFAGVGCDSSNQSSQPGISAQNEQFGGERLQGSWGNGCQAIKQNELNNAQSGESRLTFSGNNVTADYALYSDSDCKNLLMTEHQQGTYALGNPPDSSENAPAIDYNLADEPSLTTIKAGSTRLRIGRRARASIRLRL